MMKCADCGTPITTNWVIENPWTIGRSPAEVSPSRCNECLAETAAGLERFAEIVVLAFTFCWSHGQPGPLPKEAYR